MRVGALQLCPGVVEAALDAARHRGIHIAVGKDDVGRFAPQFLHNAFDGVCSRLGHCDAGTGGASRVKLTMSTSGCALNAASNTVTERS